MVTEPSPAHPAASPRSVLPFRASELRAWLVPVLAIAGFVVLNAAGLNETLFFSINRVSTVTGETVWQWLTILGDGLVALVLVLPFLRRRPDLVWAAVLAAVLTGLYVRALKEPVAALRPAAVLAPERFVAIGAPLKYNSFPSGHTATIFALAGVLSLHIANRGAFWLLFFAATAIGLSRVAVGAHWPVDVLGGAFGGWLAALLGTWLAARWRWGVGASGQRFLVTLLVLCAVGLLVWPNRDYPAAVWPQRIIAMLCLAHAFVWLRRRLGGYD